MGVYLCVPHDDYSAMKWPCADWFHVPLSSEWVSLCWVLTTSLWLPSDRTTLRDYLKMPYSGYRSGTDGNVRYQGDQSYYWTSTPTWDSSYILSQFNPQFAARRTDAHPIRCFKDSPEVPNSSRTVLYQWTGDAWIYRSSSLWLISISWDGTNWTTISDKNLWATTVYNNWNTLSEANCWKYYQWGNNYWFPWTWSITTSSTQVDATNYWPWNYYSSPTFITSSVNPYIWDTSKNWDLRWWVTGVVLAPTTELKNAYIGEWIWKPWANTLAYYPFSSNATDQTGNTTLGWSWVQDGLGYRPSNGGALQAQSSDILRYTNLWLKVNSFSGSIVGMWTNVDEQGNSAAGGYYIRHNNSTYKQKMYVWVGNDFLLWASTSRNPTAWVWYNVSWGRDGDKWIFSVNGVVTTLYNQNTGWSINEHTAFFDTWDYVISKLIVENTVRSDSKITDYYNQTKSDYGL